MIGRQGTTGTEMPAQARYAVWNNKGGVGKTFVSFVVATEYAFCHPDETVVVIDMCPQANISEILLGGNGKGSANLSKLLSQRKRQTIGGYFDDRLVQPHSKTGTEASFLVDLKQHNANMPSNILLVAGDPSLEIQAQAINQIAAQTLPSSSWANVHKWVLDLISGIQIKHQNSTFFIDCNPSFSAYTELALLASNRLIVPCTADGSSARAIDNIGQLLYGINVPQDYSAVNFASKARDSGLSLPSIHLVPLNRSTQYEKTPSKAFGAMYGEIKDRVIDLMGKRRNSFSTQDHNLLFLDIPDAHAVSVVASHHGMPLRGISGKKYTIHDQESQIRPDSLARYKDAVAEIVGLL